MMDIGEVLKQLSETPGPSGMERRVADALEELWSPLVDVIERDRVGSLLATKYGKGDEPRSRILLAAHMDEIGLMVKQIVREPDAPGGSGFLHATKVDPLTDRNETHSLGRPTSRLRGLHDALTHLL